MTKETEPLTPLEALLKFREICPWAKWCFKSYKFGYWTFSQHKPDVAVGISSNHYIASGRQKVFEFANIKYEGGWKDSITQWKEGEDDLSVNLVVLMR